MGARIAQALDHPEVREVMRFACQPSQLPTVFAVLRRALPRSIVAVRTFDQAIRVYDGVRIIRLAVDDGALQLDGRRSHAVDSAFLAAAATLGERVDASGHRRLDEAVLMDHPLYLPVYFLFSRSPLGTLAALIALPIMWIDWLTDQIARRLRSS